MNRQLPELPEGQRTEGILRVFYGLDFFYGNGHYEVVIIRQILRIFMGSGYHVGHEPVDVVEDGFDQ